MTAEGDLGLESSEGKHWQLELVNQADVGWMPAARFDFLREM